MQFRFVVVRQAWVRSGADEGMVPGSRQIRGRGADVGRSRADEGVVPRSRQSRSRGQADEDGDGDPGQTETVAQEGTGTDKD